MIDSPSVETGLLRPKNSIPLRSEAGRAGGRLSGKMKTVQSKQGDEVTRLLTEWRNGSQQALEALTPIIYAELRRLAGLSMKHERSASTLQPTALIHEAYLRLVQQGEHANAVPNWQDRHHFFRVAARLMRQILVDHARKQQSQKRGGNVAKFSFDEAFDFAPERNNILIALDDALNALAEIDPRRARIVELRYFGGFDLEETAEALGVSPATVGREQRLAQAWLHRELSRTRTV